MTCCDKCGAECGEAVNCVPVCVPVSGLEQWRGMSNAVIVLRNPSYSSIPPGFDAKFGAFTEHDQLCPHCSARGIIEMCRAFLGEPDETAAAYERFLELIRQEPGVSVSRERAEEIARQADYTGFGAS